MVGAGHRQLGNRVQWAVQDATARGMRAVGSLIYQVRVTACDSYLQANQARNNGVIEERWPAPRRRYGPPLYGQASQLLLATLVLGRINQLPRPSLGSGRKRLALGDRRLGATLSRPVLARLRSRLTRVGRTRLCHADHLLSERRATQEGEPSRLRIRSCYSPNFAKSHGPGECSYPALAGFLRVWEETLTHRGDPHKRPGRRGLHLCSSQYVVAEYQPWTTCG
jgi:hypothetical protein